MLMKEEKKENGIFQVFDMEKFFDKESLLDTMHTLNKKAKISDKDYRMWYMLNENGTALKDYLKVKGVLRPLQVPNYQLWLQ